MALPYKKSEAKAWSREHMKGVCNVIMPSFTHDLRALNEKAIRFDVRRCIELGFWGSLVVSECATTKDEYKRFLEIVIDEAKGRLKAVVHGSFDTVEDVLEICKFGESVGAELLLTTYGPNFYPKSADDIRTYTQRLLDGTNLASVLFSVHQWQFGRIHPSAVKNAPWRPVPIVRLRDKLDLASEYCENIVTWGYQEHCRAVLGDAARRWCADYQGYCRSLR